jgi:hypothetical protein
MTQVWILQPIYQLNDMELVSIVCYVQFKYMRLSIDPNVEGVFATNNFTMEVYYFL